MRCIFGELQYELLLAIFWENAYEPCSFGAEEPLAFPFGRVKPPLPPQTTVLGVDKSLPPNWKFDVHIKSVYGVAEKLPPHGFLPLGYGPDLGRVRCSAPCHHGQLPFIPPALRDPHLPFSQR